jgi:hypothetical protein
VVVCIPRFINFTSFAFFPVQHAGAIGETGTACAPARRGIDPAGISI